jgi:hypothetical protein
MGRSYMRAHKKAPPEGGAVEIHDDLGEADPARGS